MPRGGFVSSRTSLPSGRAVTMCAPSNCLLTKRDQAILPCCEGAAAATPGTSATAHSATTTDMGTDRRLTAASSSRVDAILRRSGRRRKWPVLGPGRADLAPVDHEPEVALEFGAPVVVAGDLAVDDEPAAAVDGHPLARHLRPAVLRLPH